VETFPIPGKWLATFGPIEVQQHNRQLHNRQPLWLPPLIQQQTIPDTFSRNQSFLQIATQTKDCSGFSNALPYMKGNLSDPIGVFTGRGTGLRKGAKFQNDFRNNGHHEIANRLFFSTNMKFQKLM